MAKKSFLVRMDEERYDDLKKSADLVGLSVNKYVTNLIEGSLAHQKTFGVDVTTTSTLARNAYVSYTTSNSVSVEPSAPIDSYQDIINAIAKGGTEASDEDSSS